MPSALISVLASFGLVILYVGERIVDNGPARTVVSGIGLLMLTVAIALRALRTREARGEKRQAEMMLLGMLLAIAVGVLIYFATSDVYAKVAGRVLSADSPKMAGILSVLWPTFILFA